MNNEELPLVKMIREVSARKYEIVLALDYYVIFPCGKRVPIDQVCAAMESDTKCRPLRMFENRLVLVLEAVLPVDEFAYKGDWNLLAPVVLNKKERLYWRQAFYLSTGTSSDKPRTWLPFDGVMFGDNNNIRQMSMGKIQGISFANMFQSERGFTRPLWVNKSPFLRQKWWRSGVEPDDTLSMGYQLLVPETLQSLERYGPLSYILASSKLGGDDMKQVGRYASDFLSRDPSQKAASELYVKELAQSHMLEPCFDKLFESLPISKADAVNDYIDRFQANWYHNKIPGVKVPTLRDISVYVDRVKMRVPPTFIKTDLTSMVSDFHHRFLKGEITPQEIQAELDKRSFMMWQGKNIGKEKIEFKISEEMFTNERFKNFMGGKRTRRAKRKGRKATRKH